MIISPDAFLMGADGVYRWSPEAAAVAWRKAYGALAATTGEITMMCGLPGSGKSTWAAAHDYERRVIFDAVLVTRTARGAVIRAAGARPVVAVHIDTPHEVCIERNAARSADRVVPADVMKRLIASFEAPTISEGLAGLIRWAP